MEQYFPGEWTKRSQVSRKNTKTSKRWKQLIADSLPLLLALELFHDSEVKTSGVLGADDDITLFSVASSYKRRN